MIPEIPPMTDDPRAEIETAFTHFFKKNAARENLASVSGIGSSKRETVAILEHLPEMLAEHDLRTMIDAPCGDLHWIGPLVPKLERYVGIDIIPDVLDRARDKAQDLGLGNAEFRVGDIVTEVFEPVDVILCRDCLVHLTFEMIDAALANFRASGSRYLLTTHFIDLGDDYVSPKLNMEIPVGRWRPLSLTLAPIDLAPPVATLEEVSFTAGGRGKTLALFDLHA